MRTEGIKSYSVTFDSLHSINVQWGHQKRLFLSTIRDYTLKDSLRTPTWLRWLWSFFHKQKKEEQNTIYITTKRSRLRQHVKEEFMVTTSYLFNVWGVAMCLGLCSTLVSMQQMHLGVDSRLIFSFLCKEARIPKTFWRRQKSWRCFCARGRSGGWDFYWLTTQLILSLKHVLLIRVAGVNKQWGDNVCASVCLH